MHRGVAAGPATRTFGVCSRVPRGAASARGCAPHDPPSPLPACRSRPQADVIPADTLRDFIAYARATCFPALTPEAANVSGSGARRGGCSAVQHAAGSAAWLTWAATRLLYCVTPVCILSKKHAGCGLFWSHTLSRSRTLIGGAWRANHLPRLSVPKPCPPSWCLCACRSCRASTLRCAAWA